MPHRLDEVHFLDKFVNMIFNSIANQKANAVKRAAAKDPELQKIIADLEKSRKNLSQWIEKRRSESPEFQSANDAVRDFYSLTQRHQ